MVGVRRGIAPGVLVQVSDLPLQTDERNLGRHDEGERQFGVREVIHLEDGPVSPYFDRVRLDELYGEFELLAETVILVGTMRGNRSTAFRRALQRQ